METDDFFEQFFKILVFLSKRNLKYYLAKFRQKAQIFFSIHPSIYLTVNMYMNILMIFDDQ